MKNTKSSLGKNKWFFDLWASTYDFAPFQFWMKKFHQPVFNEITNKEIKILDLSCGSGELLNELHKRCPNAKLYGVDISSKMLEIARKKLPKNVKLQKMDVHKLKYPNNYFDFVVSTEALHHYYDQVKALQEMKRVVKNEGKVMIVDINFIFNFVHYIFQKIEPGCVKVNSKKEMRQLFVNCELNNIKQERNFMFSVATVGIKIKN